MWDIGRLKVRRRELKRDYEGNRCGLEAVWKKRRDCGERIKRGSEFQIIGAANKKERRQLANRMSGISGRYLSDDLRIQFGV